MDHDVDPDIVFLLGLGQSNNIGVVGWLQELILQTLVFHSESYHGYPSLGQSSYRVNELADFGFVLQTQLDQLLDVRHSAVYSSVGLKHDQSLCYTQQKGQHNMLNNPQLVAERVLASNNPSLNIFFLQILSGSDVLPQSLQKLCKTLISQLYTRLTEMPLHEVCMVMQEGVDILLESTFKLHKLYEQCSVLVLDCFCLTDLVRGKQQSQTQFLTCNSFKVTAFKRMIRFLKWKQVSPLLASLLLNYLRSRFKMNLLKELENFPECVEFFVQVLITLQQAHNQYIIALKDLIIQLLTLTEAQPFIHPLQLVHTLIKGLFVTIDPNHHKHIIGLILKIVQIFGRQLQIAMHSSQGDYRPMLISLIEAYMISFSHLKQINCDRLLMGLISCLLQLQDIRLRSIKQSVEKIYFVKVNKLESEFAQTLHILSSSNFHLGPLSTFYLINYAVQAYRKKSLSFQEANLTLALTVPFFRLEESDLLKRMAALILSLSEQENLRLFQLSNFNKIFQKLLQAPQNSMTLELAQNFLQLSLRLPNWGLAGYGRASQKNPDLLSLLRTLLANTLPTANLIVVLLKTFQQIYAQDEGSKYPDFLNMCFEYFVRHQLAVAATESIYRSSKFNTLVGYGFCLAVSAVALDDIQDNLRDRVCTMLSKEQTLTQQKRIFKDLMKDGKLVKLQSPPLPFQIEVGYLSAFASLVKTFLSEGKSQAPLKLINRKMVEKASQHLKLFGLSTIEPEISSVPQQAFKTLSSLPKFKARLGKQEQPSKQILARCWQKLKGDLVQLQNYKSRCEYGQMGKLLVNSKLQFNLLLDSIRKYRVKAVLVNFRGSFSAKLQNHASPKEYLAAKNNILNRMGETATIFAEHLTNKVSHIKAERRHILRNWKLQKKRHLNLMADLLGLPKFYKQSKLQVGNARIKLFNDINLHFKAKKFISKVSQESQLGSLVKGGLESRSSMILDAQQVLALRDGKSEEWEMVFDCQYISRTKIIFGQLRISKSEIFFIAKPGSRNGFWLQSSDKNNWSNEAKQKSVRLKLLEKAFKRRIMYRHCGVELFTYEVKGYLFNLQREEEAKSILRFLSKLEHIKVVEQLPQAFKAQALSERWLRNQISNLQYLMALNSYSGRSYNDLSQYPVVPWVISNYSEAVGYLEHRDLSKPVGQLNQHKFAKCQKKLKEKMELPPQYLCLFDSFFSAPTIVKNYLIRIQPFLTLHYELQGKKIDVADRLFNSMAEQYDSALNNDGDYKQLIPEFYYDASFLRNLNSVDLGIKQNGSKVQDVKLPPWSSSPEQFIALMRQQLQSKGVSQQLHNWIDLVFGYKADQKNGLKFNNLFQIHTYQGPHLATATDNRTGLITRISEFGQFPIRLFDKPHPAKSLRARPCFDTHCQLKALKAQQFCLAGQRVYIISSGTVSEMELSYSAKQSTRPVLFQKKTQILKEDPQLIASDNLVLLRNAKGFSVVRCGKKAKSVYKQIGSSAMGLQEQFIIIGNKQGRLVCYMLDSQLGFEKVWDFRQRGRIQRIEVKKRLVLVKTEEKVILLSIFGKYLSGCDCHESILSFDLSEQGYVLFYHPEHKFTLLTTSLKVLFQGRIETSSEEFATSACFCQEHLPYLCLGSNKGRILTISIFSLTKPERLRQQDFRVLYVSDGKVLNLRAGPIANSLFRNLMWIKEDGRISYISQIRTAQQAKVNV